MPEVMSEIRILCSTQATPDLPLITAGSTRSKVRDLLRETLMEVCSQPGLRPIIDQLLLEGFEPVFLENYKVCLELEQEAKALGYDRLQ